MNNREAFDLQKQWDEAEEAYRLVTTAVICGPPPPIDRPVFRDVTHEWYGSTVHNKNGQPGSAIQEIAARRAAAFT